MPLRFERRPRNAAELLTFVAHFGTRVARSRLGLPLEAIAMAAARAARRDPSLARMLPVFLWRIRGELDLDELIKLVKGSPDAPVLGYFLELAGELGSFGPFRRRVSALRDDVRRNRPMYLFAKMARNPFERLAAETRTPEAARRWGLLTGTPTDSFESYFRKVAGV